MARAEAVTSLELLARDTSLERLRRALFHRPRFTVQELLTCTSQALLQYWNESTHNENDLLPQTSKKTDSMKGNAQQTKVHFKGKDDDFIVFADSKEAVQNWKKDSSVPLAQVVSGFKVFVTHK